MSEQFTETPVEPEAPLAEEPQQEEWAGPSQEEWAEAREALDLVRQAMQPEQQQYIDPYQQQPYQQQQQQPIDFLADDAQAQLDAYIESKLAPYASYQEQLIMGEAEERAKDIVHSLETEHGEFLDPKLSDLTMQVANQYLPQTQARFGYGPRAAEAALELAYNEMKAFEQNLGKAYYERQVNEIRGLAQAPRVPQGATGQQAGQQMVVPEGGDELSVVAKYFNPHTT